MRRQMVTTMYKNIINRTLHGRLEIRNSSSRVETIHSKRNFVSLRGHVISSISFCESFRLLWSYQIIKVHTMVDSGWV